MAHDVTTRMDPLLAAFDPADIGATAAAIEALWLEFEPQRLGGIKVELRRQHKMVGIPIPVLREIAKPLKKAAARRVHDHLPLAL